MKNDKTKTEVESVNGIKLCEYLRKTINKNNTFIDMDSKPGIFQMYEGDYNVEL